MLPCVSPRTLKQSWRREVQRRAVFTADLAMHCCPLHSKLTVIMALCSKPHHRLVLVQDNSKHFFSPPNTQFVLIREGGEGGEGICLFTFASSRALSPCPKREERRQLTGRPERNGAICPAHARPTTSTQQFQRSQNPVTVSTTVGSTAFPLSEVHVNTTMALQGYVSHTSPLMPNFFKALTEL